MKTISTHLIANNHEFNQLQITRKSQRNYNFNQAAGDINRNAALAQVEYERDACEEELYRLRYGIENLLSNKQYGDTKSQQQQQRSFINVQNPFRTMTNKTIDFMNRKKMNWFDRCCSSCCRRWRRNRNDNQGVSPNEYNNRYRTPESLRQTQLNSDSHVSMSPSRSISSRYIDPNTSRTKNDLKNSIRSLINRKKPDISSLLTSKDINNPAYNSLIIKILEAKALDCLCSGYSKQNTQKQIKQALSDINQRTNEHQWDSASVTSSQSIPGSYDSSSVSSVLTADQPLDSRFTTPQVSRSSSASQRSHVNGVTSALISPNKSTHKTKSSLKLNDKIKSPRKKSKVSIVGDKPSKSRKSKDNRRSSSKHRSKTKSRSKPKRKTTSGSQHKQQQRKTKSRSQQPRKSTSGRKKPGKSNVSNRKQSLSKSRKKDTSKSPLRKNSSKKLKPKKSRSSKRKRPKSNNQTDDYATIMLPTYTYPSTYQEIYRNERKPFKLLSSVI